MKNNTFLSVIIPHKDSPDLLSRCISSIPSSNDIQVIVVDDNSNDENKKKILTCKRENIEIIFSNNNITAGGARNLALEKVKGEWVVFSDADDFFTKDAFFIFKETLLSGVDLFYFKVKSLYSDTLEPARRHIGINYLIDNFDRDHNLVRVKHIVPWGKVFSAKFIKEGNFTFDEVPASNDIIFGVHTGFYAKKILVIKKVIYCITINKGSISNTLTKNNNRSRYYVMLRYNLFLRENNLPNYQNSIRPFIFNSLKFGFSEFVNSLKMLVKYKGSFFYNFSLKNSLNSFLKQKKDNDKNTKYIIK